MLSSEGLGPSVQLHSRGTLIALVAICFPSVTCGPTLKRDLSATPVGQVGFDDLCGLQGYFDTLEQKKAIPPKLIDSAQVESETARGGRSRFAFETDFQLATVKRILSDNWRRLPDETASAKRIDLEVQWSDKGGLRRVVTTEDATLYLNEKQSAALPYHVCLSELLFGAPIYRQRRDVLGLAPLPLSRSMVLTDNADAGAVDGGVRGEARTDAGAPATSSPTPR